MMDTPAPQPRVQSSAPAAAPATRRVLLAEDDAEMRGLLASALRRSRYEVIEAADGKELVRKLSESIIHDQRIDCIVTDVVMPRFTGLQVLRLIHESDVEIPVVVITAFGDHAMRVEAWMLGAAAVLDKPFEIEALMDEIRRTRSRP